MKKPFSIVDLVKRILFVDFMKGLSLTLRYTVSRSVTLRYPDEEKWVPYRRFRGKHTLNRDERGKELCVACELCVKVCPTNCITVVPAEDKSGRGISDRVAAVWTVNLLRCLFCGYCEDACPTTAVRLGRDFEIACSDKSCTFFTKEELLVPQVTPEYFKGGVVVAARLGKDKVKGVPVIAADFEKQKPDWWQRAK